MQKPGINKILSMVIQGESVAKTHFLSLSCDNKCAILKKLFLHTEEHPEKIDYVVNFIGEMLPQLEKDKRFPCLLHLIKLLSSQSQNLDITHKLLCNIPILEELQPLERTTLAYGLLEMLQHKNHNLKRVALLGLVKIIPQLHENNQKEFVYDIFLLHESPHNKDLVLEGLTSLLYNMEQNARIKLTLFFSEMLLNNSQPQTQYLLIDLLTNFTPALPEQDRIIIADRVAPFVYFSDLGLVKKSINYFASILCLLPPYERFDYAQMVASLIHDPELRNPVIEALHKMLPFIIENQERLMLQELLSQYDRSTTQFETSHAYIPAYYKQID